MSLFHLVLVALVQGITEFLPISSSGHLILLPRLTGLPDQGLVIDVAVHVGTLAAVLVYFRADFAGVFRGIPRLLAGRLDSPEARLALLLVIATVPAVLAGLALSLSGQTAALRSVAVIGWTTLIFGLLLWWIDTRAPQERAARDWTMRDAIVMGLWQALALVPGTSRSGITITAARHLGYKREDAIRLAMLMAAPTIAASGVLVAAEVIGSADAGAARDGALAAVLSFLAALAALAVMIRLARRISFAPYVVYRVALGLALLAIAYG